jgi:formylglycine-generating enzyme required for sulfatase activity
LGRQQLVWVSRFKTAGFIYLTALSLLGACKSLAPQQGTREGGALATVPAGWFLMGSDEGPISSRPRRRVYVDSFAIDVTEVTVGAFRRYAETTGLVPSVWSEDNLPRQGDRPMVGILWQEADAYCRWLGKRLPTEAEWEKAARGRDGRSYPWGNDWDSQLANTQELGRGGVVDVGSYPLGASPYGVLDMAGNAQEWVSDYFDARYYSYGTVENPRGPTKVLDHGLRGGSWAASAGHSTTYFRNSSHSVLPNERVGFRCAISR